MCDPVTAAILTDLAVEDVALPALLDLGEVGALGAGTGGTAALTAGEAASAAAAAEAASGSSPIPELLPNTPAPVEIPELLPNTPADALRADNIDVGGGFNPATGAGDALTAQAALDTGVTASAGIPATGMPAGVGSPISITDALRGANLANSLLGQPRQQGVPFQPKRSAMNRSGVDVSGLLGLLNTRPQKYSVRSLLE
jgi:hypothetical protein